MSTPEQTYLGTGRRKKATCRVRLAAGEGKFTINGRTAEEYFSTEVELRAIRQPFVVTEKEGQFDVTVSVNGGGLMGQSQAVALGISRALLTLEPDLRGQLKPAGLLKRDPRRRERKKSGQPGARKRFQFSKR